MTQLAVLYVDDDDDIRHIVELALSQDPGIVLRVVSSGEEALAVLARGWHPDVAVLDVSMPGLDGPALLRTMRSDPALAAIPVLFLTARSRAADLDGYLSEGACGVIVKPFDPIRLAHQIRAALAAPHQATGSTS